MTPNKLIKTSPCFPHTIIRVLSHYKTMPYLESGSKETLRARHNQPGEGVYFTWYLDVACVGVVARRKPRQMLRHATSISRHCRPRRQWQHHRPCDPLALPHWTPHADINEFLHFFYPFFFRVRNQFRWNVFSSLNRVHTFFIINCDFYTVIYSFIKNFSYTGYWKLVV